jgi:O-antigen/teichoic acid export membrane protein
MNLFRLISASAIILGVSFLLRFLLTFALARILMPDQLGIYSWSVTAFGIAGIVTNFGLDFFLIRKIPEYKNSMVSMVSNVIEHTKKQVNTNTILIISIILPISYFSPYYFEGASQYNFELMAIVFALPFAAYLMIYSTSIRAYEFPLTGQFIESILQTAILLLVIYFGFIVFSDSIPKELLTLYLVGFFVFSWVISCLISNKIFSKHIKLSNSIEPSKNNTKTWRKDSATIMLGVLGWSFLGRSDVFLLGFLVNPSEVGAYFLCLRLAETLMFFSTVSYYVWGAEISNLIQNSDFESSQIILRKSSRLCILTTSIMTFTFWSLSEEILFFINDSYVKFDYLLKVALIVFFIKGAAGMLPSLYYILGEQDFLAKFQWALGLFFVTLIFVLVPFYGLIGCLIAFAFCQSLYVVILGVRLKIKYGLSILPI